MKTLFLNFYIAGLQHAGKHLADMVRKLRNPTANPGFVVKSTWERLRRNPKNPKLTLQLNNFLHPSVKVNVMQIEKNVTNHLNYYLGRVGIVGETCPAISNGCRNFISSTWKGSGQ